MKSFIIVVSLLAGWSLAVADAADTCQAKPVAGYSSTDGVVLSDAGHIITFVAECPSNVAPAYAYVNGQILTVTKVEGKNLYQISWSVNIKKASSGSYDIRLFNEEGLAHYRKSQGLDKALATFNYGHSSPYRGPIISSEFAALLIGLGISYLALSNRFKISSKRI